MASVPSLLWLVWSLPSYFSLYLLTWWQVLPLARKHCSIEEQRDLLYQSLCVMPLKLLERVLPWLAAVLSEDEAKDMLHNMRLAGMWQCLALGLSASATRVEFRWITISKRCSLFDVKHFLVSPVASPDGLLCFRSDSKWSISGFIVELARAHS